MSRDVAVMTKGNRQAAHGTINAEHVWPLLLCERSAESRWEHAVRLCVSFARLKSSRRCASASHMQPHEQFLYSTRCKCKVSTAIVRQALVKPCMAMHEDLSVRYAFTAFTLTACNAFLCVPRFALMCLCARPAFSVMSLLAK